MASFVKSFIVDKTRETIFPGAYGKLKVKYLEEKQQRGEYPQISKNVVQHNLTSAIGSQVGIWVYHAKPVETSEIEAEEIIISFHGNIRPSQFLNELHEHLACAYVDDTDSLAYTSVTDRRRTVVAVDFPGYGASSAPTKGDNLELMLKANNLAVYDWVSTNLVSKSDTGIVLSGRSIGTLSVVSLLDQPRIRGAMLLVPFTNISQLLTNMVMGSKVSFLDSHNIAAQAAIAAAFPSGHQHDLLSNFQSTSFDTAQQLRKLHDEGLLRNKTIWIIPAEHDELVSHDEALEINQLVESANVRTLKMEGDHRALPGDGKLRNDEVLKLLVTHFFSSVNKNVALL